MADETVTAPTPELAVEAPAQPVVEQAQVIEEPVDLNAPVDDDSTGVEVDPAQIAEEEYEDFEHDGKTYQISKALKPFLMRDKDYTQGKQTLAAQRKEMEARQADIEQRSKATDEELDLRSDLRFIDRQLSEYKKLTQADWDAHYATDYKATDRAWRQFQALKESRTEVANAIGAAEAKRTETSQSDLTKRIQDTLEHAKTKIPGWTEQTIPQLVDFAQKAGVSDDQIKSLWSPTFIDILHKASLGEQLLKKQAVAPRPQNGNVRPLNTVTGKTTPTANTDLASADMDTYVAARKKGIGGTKFNGR